MDTMKSYMGTIVLIGFAGVSLFGAFAMAADADHLHGHASCLATAILGNSCPADSDPIEFMGFHLNALNSITLATTTSSILALLVFLALWTLFFTGKPELSENHLFQSPVGTPVLSSVKSIRHLLFWISLCERRIFAD